ncbi:MAG: type II toxin-antitoxin system mRNA interferase toxin, RelE/StbE family [Candidatus Kerfeldbacteria bacterium]|nr:type II toxin-antitoxin system mRNA interferase toxin, RelE/StbE family [Candidatus Kerfeldbacteria bacterium]
MKITEIVYSRHFARSMQKLPPELKVTVRKREAIFRNDCFDPRLRTHKLSGKLKDYWSFSLTHSHRVLFQFLGNERAEFIDVGDHSIYE